MVFRALYNGQSYRNNKENDKKVWRSRDEPGCSHNCWGLSVGQIRWDRRVSFYCANQCEPLLITELLKTAAFLDIFKSYTMSMVLHNRVQQCPPPFFSSKFSSVSIFPIGILKFKAMSQTNQLQGESHYILIKNKKQKKN